MGHNIGIVDDEKLVLFGIQSLLSEDDSPFSIAGTWLNARDALSHCIESPPDLLLTDIGMPGMDGLELIRQLKRHNLPTKVVVLSCHDEYDLVHEAFLLGAEDYLLKKDIDKGRIYEILSRVLPEGCGNRYAAQVDVNDFRTFVSGDLESPGLLGVMGFKKEYDDRGTELQWEPDTAMVLQVVRDVLSPSDRCFLDDIGRLVIFLPQPDRLREKDDVDPRMERVRSAVSRYLNRKVYIFQLVAIADDDAAELHARALKGLDGMFYIPESSVLRREVGEAVASGSFVLPLGSWDGKDSWRKVLGDFISLVKEEKPDPTSVKAECVFAVNHLLYHLKEYKIADTADIIPEYARSYPSILNGMNDMRRLTDWLELFLTDLYRRISEKRREHRPLPEIRSYIAHSLEKDLRLSLVAEKFGLNPNYLSALFKKDTGLSYIEYVNKKRIHLAGELLRSTNLSAKEISYRCGYRNPNYFSRVFKSIVGCTISEYRRDTTL